MAKNNDPIIHAKIADFKFSSALTLFLLETTLVPAIKSPILRSGEKREYATSIGQINNVIFRIRHCKGLAILLVLLFNTIKPRILFAGLFPKITSLLK